ncbi:hypothetical protein [Acidovorax sp. CF316]|uniref:hypothetical protein n=1 Tax=Acidovorax sp. CF316 TaxID=1144317 RepID=UPI0011B24AE1|nr:hypothetical protein [Acidovorax sp. CF316]
MEALWPWLAMAGMGALHGCVAATRRAHALQMLLPLVAGHAAAVAWVLAGALALPQALAWVLGLAAIGLAARQWRQRHAAVHAGLALGCFLVSLLHGEGLMLVPALAPLCLGGPAPGQGAALWTSPVLLDVLAAMAAHLAAMLAVAAAAGTVAGLASRGARACALSAARPCADAGGH